MQYIHKSFIPDGCNLSLSSRFLIDPYWLDSYKIPTEVIEDTHQIFTRTLHFLVRLLSGPYKLLLRLLPDSHMAHAIFSQYKYKYKSYYILTNMLLDSY